MEKASQYLMHEHAAILLILNVLEKICSRLKTEEGADHRDIQQIIDLIKNFADKCHHGKEEEYLFPALEAAGIKKANGPIGVMLFEHEKGRGLIRLMQDSVSDKFIRAEKFIDSSTLYIDLLRNHIEKENTILFPMGDARLTEAKQAELIKNFETHEDEVIGKGKHHELHLILEKFEKKYLN